MNPYCVIPLAAAVSLLFMATGSVWDGQEPVKPHDAGFPGVGPAFAEESNPAHSMSDMLDDLVAFFRDLFGEEPPITLATDSYVYEPYDTIVFSGYSTGSERIAVIEMNSGTNDPYAVQIQVRDDGTFEGAIAAMDWGPGVVTADITHGSLSDQAKFTMVLPEPEIMLLGRTVSAMEVESERITIQVEHDLAVRNVDMIIPHAVLEMINLGTDDHIRVIIDGERALHADVSTQNHRILTLFNIPEEGHSIELSRAKADRTTDVIPDTPTCHGSAACITGIIEKITDGDTVRLTDGTKVRFALASAPELSESGGQKARALIEEVCPPGSSVVVDEDDLQTGGSYGRTLGVVHCNGVNLNEYLLDSGIGYIIKRYCSTSEFSSHEWAYTNGCS